MDKRQSIKAFAIITGGYYYSLMPMKLTYTYIQMRKVVIIIHLSISFEYDGNA